MRGYTGTYVTNGPPGTGKTSWLAEQICEIARHTHVGAPPVLVCSLTRTAAAEIAAAASRKASAAGLYVEPERIGTLHSHAYRALGCPKVAEGEAEHWNEEHPAYRLGGTRLDPDDPLAKTDYASTPGDALFGEYQTLRARQIDPPLWPITVRAFGDAWDSWKKENDLIDFTDMIECALRDDVPPTCNPEIIISDEAQDHSALEIALLTAWGKRAGALVLAGDPYQALYTWRGAHPEIFLSAEIPADHRKILHQSWRVPRTVHGVAMRWLSALNDYQAIDYLPRDADGEVQEVAASWKAPELAIRKAEELLAQGKTVMFQASCGFFLRPLLACLHQRGIPFANPWRRKRGDWNPLGGGGGRGISMRQRILDLLKPDPRSGAQHGLWSWREVNRWAGVLRAEKGLLSRNKRDWLAEQAAAEKAAPKATEVWPTVEDLRQFLEPSAAERLHAFFVQYGEADLAGLLDWYEAALVTSKKKGARYPIHLGRTRGLQALTEEPRLFVGTTHAFKGAEADAVFIFPDLSPAGYQEYNHRTMRDNIIRLFYVALTRARESVFLCRAATPRSVHIDIQKGE